MHPWLIFFIYPFLLYKSFTNSTPLFPKEALPTKSGYLPINPSTKSAIFYTFYESQSPTSSLSETPFLIWLQGGPGCSSSLGNFYELGPWRVSENQNTKEIKLEQNPAPWNRLFGVLFLDNPIGVGFSIASKPEEIPRDEHAVGEQLFSAIKAFIELNPCFKTRPIYIAGESYAGKYVPAIGYYILKKNPYLPISEQVNLAGIAIGNGLTDPITQVGTHALNAYFSGLINYKQKIKLEELQSEAIRLTRIKNWNLAAIARNKVLNTLQNMTGLATLYDFRRQMPYKTELVERFLNQKGVKTVLGVNESIMYEECSEIVGSALHEDVMKSSKFMVEYLVKNSRVLLYQGQCDLRDGVVSTEAWVKTMNWEGIEKFQEAERKVWRVNGKLAGYVQKWGSLSNVVVMGAGHLVPTDQELNSQRMVEDWVLERGLFVKNRIRRYDLDVGFMFFFNDFSSLLFIYKCMFSI